MRRIALKNICCDGYCQLPSEGPGMVESMRRVDSGARCPWEGCWFGCVGIALAWPQAAGCSLSLLVRLCRLCRLGRWKCKGATSGDGKASGEADRVDFLGLCR